MWKIFLRSVMVIAHLLIILVVASVTADAQAPVPLSHESVRMMDWNSEGTLLAVGNPEGWLSVVDTEGREVQRLQADKTAIASIAWSTDGTLLATSGDDGVIRVWDTATWALLKEFGEYSYGAFYMTWSPDDAVLIGVGFDSFQVWNPVTGEPLTEAFSISLDGIAWRPHSSSEFAYLHWQGVGTMKFSNGKLEAGTGFEQFSDQFSRYTIDWNADGSRLIVAGKQDSIRVWNGDSGKLEVEIPAREHFIKDITFISETQAVAVTERGAVVLADFETNTIAIVGQFDAYLQTMAWNPRLALLNIGGYSGIVTNTVYGETRAIDAFQSQIALDQFLKEPPTP